MLSQVLLFILFCYNISLPGAGHGVKAYIGTWEFDALRDSSIWTDAAGQIFFTLSVSMGIMTAYGSYLNPKSDLVMVRGKPLCLSIAFIETLSSRCSLN